MDQTKIVAIILMVAGVLGLIYGGFSYTKSTQEAKIGPFEKGLWIEFEGVAGDNREPPRIMRRDLLKRGHGAPVPLDGDHLPRAFGEQRARQPAGAWADFDDGHASQGARRARDAAGEIEIEQEVLAEGFFGGKPVPPDHVAQRRQVGSRAHVSAAAGVRCLP